MSNKFELAWAAGFFDGEGSISVTKIKGFGRLLIQIGQSDIRPLIRFKNAVNCGTINGPYQIKNYKPMWRFSIRIYKDCKKTLELLWPFMSEPKKEQATPKLLEAEECEKMPRIPRNKRFPGNPNATRNKFGRFTLTLNPMLLTSMPKG